MKNSTFLLFAILVLIVGVINGFLCVDLGKAEIGILITTTGVFFALLMLALGRLADKLDEMIPELKEKPEETTKETKES